MAQPYNSTAGVGNVASKVSNVRYSNAGEQELVKQQGNTGLVLAAGVNKLREQVEAADVMKANNEYNLRMNELRNKLMQNKEGNALENARLYAEGRQKIVDDILKRGPETVKGGIGKRAFMTTIDKDWVNQQGTMDRYVLGEAEKYQNTQLYNQLYTGINEVTGNFMDDDAVQSAVNRGNHFIAARYLDYGEERIKAEQMKWQAKAYGTQITAALNQSDYQKAEEILKSHGDVLTPEAKLKIEATITERKKSDKELALFNELYAKGDLVAAINYVNNSDDYKTASERLEAEKNLISFFSFKEKEQRVIDDARFDDWQNQIMQWKQQGVPMEEAIKRAEKWAGYDTSLFAKATKAVRNGYYGTEGKGLPYGMEPAIYDMLRTGDFSSKEKLDNFLRANGASKEEYNRFMKSYADREAGVGVYAKNWDRLKKEIMAGSKLEDAQFDKAWNEAQAAAHDYINETIQKEHRMPSDTEIIQKAKEGMIKTYYGGYDNGDWFFSSEKNEYSKGELLRSGVRNVVRDGKTYKVTLTTGKTLEMTGYQLDRYVTKGE